MDKEISRWLKHDLGLPYMCERDVSGFMYHPRYGTICRKLLTFLYESTLCSQKYPDVFAKDEFEKVTDQFNKTNHDLDRISDELEKKIIAHSNTDMRLDYLKAKLDYLNKLKKLQEKSLESLKLIANRPTATVERVKDRIDHADYIQSSELISIYSVEPETLLCNYEPVSNDSNILVSNIAIEYELDDELDKHTKGVDTIHGAIDGLLSKLSNLKDCSSHDKLDLVDMNMNNLVALHIPTFKEETPLNETGFHELKLANYELSRLVTELNSEIREAQQKYEHMATDTARYYKEQREKLSLFSDNLHDLEMNIQPRSNMIN